MEARGWIFEGIRNGTDPGRRCNDERRVPGKHTTLH